MNYRDLDSINQSFNGLSDTILKSRMMAQQRDDRAQDVDFRNRELDERVKQNDFERSPTNPKNRSAEAEAKIHEDQVKKLGITQIESAWTTADGREMKLKASPAELAEAMKSAPPSPQTKVTSRFITKDGVEHVITGTPEQLKAQQDAMGAAGGGIQSRDAEIQQFMDADGNSHNAIVNNRTGAVHILKEGNGGSVTVTEGKRDPNTGEIHEVRTTTPSRPGASAAVPAATKTGTAGTKRPTRAVAAQFVTKFGKAKAIEELKRAGYDPTGYAD